MNTRENLIFRPRPDIIRLLILGVTVLAFSPALFCGSDIQAGTAPQILYVEKGEKSQNFLAVINQDGTGGRRVSKGFFFIVSPRTCRAHDIIVFTVHNEAMKTSVHLLYPDGRSEKVIENAAAHNWSPDGKAILYSPSGEECDLFSYTLSTKSSERMTKGKQIMEACWSPDMKKIALSIMEKNGSFDLYLYSVQSKSLEKLTTTPQVTENSPSFSADGKEVFYTHQPFKGLAGCDPGWMEKIDILSKSVTSLSIPGISFPSLSPDGTWIVFEESEGTDKIGVCRSDGASRATLPVPGSSPTWLK